MRPRLWLTAALPLAVFAISGCGGGDGGDSSTAAAPVVTTTPTTLSKEELIAQGDAICAEVNAAVGTVSSGSTDSSSQVAQEADLYGGMVERLKGLGTPDETTGYAEFISAADELAQAESDAELASERGDESGLAAAQEEASSALASFQSAAQAYGFEECGEAPSAPVSSATTTPSETAPPEGGVEVEEEAVTPESEPAPETGGAGGTAEAAPPSGGGTAGGGGGTSGGSSGGIGPG
jgi:hypothetical protein